eukprot:TRINITY_DN8655_c0_g1_i1.p1 TRINITY_DN8655_c0_g1~~TRINITY_DN8655_c0_g1_i1.p1  ORF type:complete len:377 (-),score=46.22 TRINITY_DN8655_c0_g1_i1:111-1241(-)
MADPSQRRSGRRRSRREEERDDCGHFTVFIILNLILFIICLTIICVLIWLRLDWGFQEWIHEMAFSNFWNGTYVTFTGTILALINCGLGVLGGFQGWSLFLSFVRMSHGASALLLFIGGVTMLSDAIGMRPKWIRDIILELIDPSHYINTLAKESFLRNLYRIAHCCGANNYKDYPEIFYISPPEECLNYHYAGARYYEEGCSTALSRWLKEWTGGLCTSIFVMIILEVLIIWKMNKILLEKKRDHLLLPQYEEYHSPRPPVRSTSLSRLCNLSSPQEEPPRVVLRPKTRIMHSTSLLDDIKEYDTPLTEKGPSSICRAKSESFLAATSNHPPLPKRISRSRSRTQDLLSILTNPRPKKRSKDFSHLHPPKRKTKK